MPHIHEKIDWTVDTFIVHDNTVLLRWHDKYDNWLGVGGHVELDEDPNAAAIREAKEEVGLDIVLQCPYALPTEKQDNFTELVPARFLNRHRVNESHEHIALIYFATSKTNTVVPDESSDRSDTWKWATKEDLETMSLKPDIKFYCLRALEELAN